LWKSTCAVCWSKIANVAPPMLTPGKVAMPEIRISLIGPNPCTRIRSPTLNPWLDAVPLSITTSPEPRGQRPVVNFVGLKI